MAISSDSSSSGKEKMKMRVPEEEIYQEGHDTVFEDKEGNVLGVRDSRGEHGAERQRHDNEKAQELMRQKHVENGVSRDEHGGALEEAPSRIESAIEHPQKTWRNRMLSYKGHGHKEKAAEPPKAEKSGHKHGPALAYQYGNTIIVEDEDGEVLKKYDIPTASKKGKEGRPANPRAQSMVESSSRAVQSLKRMGTHMGVPTAQQAGPSGTQAANNKKKQKAAEAAAKEQEDDDLLRFTVTAGGRRMSKLEFIQQMCEMNPKDRAKFVQASDAPEAVKHAAVQDAKDHTAEQRRRAASVQANVPAVVGEDGEAELHKIESSAAQEEGQPRGPEGLTLVDSNNEHVPFHSGRQDLGDRPSDKGGEDAAQRRRRLAAENIPAETSGGSAIPPSSQLPEEGFEGETAAERRRRLGALGVGKDDTPESDSEDEETGDPLETGRGTHSRAAEPSQKALSPMPRAPGIRFADQPRVPTKDERAAADAREKEEDQKEKDGKKKSGLSKLIGRK
jgi:hypothetical protein